MVVDDEAFLAVIDFVVVAVLVVNVVVVVIDFVVVDVAVVVNVVVVIDFVVVIVPERGLFSFSRHH